MKKILSIVFTLLIVSSSFAQSAKYKELFEKAQKYEQEKKWVYALGTYYDAMETEQTENALPAYKAFEKLANTIKNGKPGYGEFDDFSLYDEWIRLLQEFESYWTEYCPHEFNVVKIEKAALNSEKKTADYKLKIQVDWIGKFDALYSDTIQKGYDVCYYSHSEWGDTFKRWPHYSAYTKGENEDFKNFSTGKLYNGAALFKHFWWKHQKLVPYEINLAAFYMGYNIQIRIEDKKGQCLAESKPSFVEIYDSYKHNISDSHSLRYSRSARSREEYYVTYEIKDVSRFSIPLIDSGEINFRISKIDLCYDYDLIGDSEKHSKKEMSVSLDKVYISPKINEKTKLINEIVDSIYASERKHLISELPQLEFVTIELPEVLDYGFIKYKKCSIEISPKQILLNKTDQFSQILLNDFLDKPDLMELKAEEQENESELRKSLLCNRFDETKNLKPGYEKSDRGYYYSIVPIGDENYASMGYKFMGRYEYAIYGDYYKNPFEHLLYAYNNSKKIRKTLKDSDLAKCLEDSQGVSNNQVFLFRILPND